MSQWRCITNHAGLGHDSFAVLISKSADGEGGVAWLVSSPVEHVKAG
jgi:hypothetical protein